MKKFFLRNFDSMKERVRLFSLTSCVYFILSRVSNSHSGNQISTSSNGNSTETVLFDGLFSAVLRRNVPP